MCFRGAERTSEMLSLFAIWKLQKGQMELQNPKVLGSMKLQKFPAPHHSGYDMLYRITLNHVGKGGGQICPLPPDFFLTEKND